MTMKLPFGRWLRSCADWTRANGQPGPPLCPVTLQQAMDTYLTVQALAKGTEQLYRYVVADFAKWAHQHHQALIQRDLGLDLRRLTEHDLSTWISRRAAEGWGEKHQRNQLSMILKLWSHAATQNPDLRAPDRTKIRRIRPWVKPTPDAWTSDELSRMIAAARRMPDLIPRGPCKGLPAGALLEAVLRLGLDTGLRRSDLWCIRYEQIHAFEFEVVMAKTRRRIRLRVQASTVAACDAVQTSPPRSEIVPRCSDNWFDARWSAMLELASLPTGPREKMQKLRRTSATLCEIKRPGSARWHLGHATPSMAERHYLDARQLGGQAITPDPLPIDIEQPARDVIPFRSS